MSSCVRKTLGGGRPIAVWAIGVLALVAVLALSCLRVRAVDTAKCEAAMKLQSDPAAAAFKACAGVDPIPPNCCIKMAAFVQYAECLQVSKYRDMADSFLQPEVTVSRALKDCLGSD